MPFGDLCQGGYHEDLFYLIRCVFHSLRHCETNAGVMADEKEEARVSSSPSCGGRHFAGKIPAMYGGLLRNVGFRPSV